MRATHVEAPSRDWEDEIETPEHEPAEIEVLQDSTPQEPLHEDEAEQEGEEEQDLRWRTPIPRT